MVRSSASTAGRSKRFVNPRTSRADTAGVMMSGSSFASGTTMDRRYFGTMNRPGQIRPILASALPNLSQPGRRASPSALLTARGALGCISAGQCDLSALKTPRYTAAGCDKAIDRIARASGEGTMLDFVQQLVSGI